MQQHYTAAMTTIDQFVEAFEQSRGINPQANLLDFFPDSDHPLFADIVTELVRVEMEYSWTDRAGKTVADYQRALPEILADPFMLGQIAFEEYRLRAQAGENVSAEEYRRRYQIDTKNWPRFAATPQHDKISAESSSLPASLVDGIWEEALTLADNVKCFPAVGEKFVGFTLQSELGQGAFARVYLAKQKELSNRLVVLKIASGRCLEPQHLARLQHSNIVPIYSVHRQNELTAVCMPYLGSRTLTDLLATVREDLPWQTSEQNLVSTFLQRKDDTRIPGQQLTDWDPSPTGSTPTKIVEALTKASYVDSVVWMVKQLADGLAHAHQRGIVHRDLKPANILLTDEGVPMVLDFNLSDDVVVFGPTNLFVGGTLPYMSPEQLRVVVSGGKLGPQTDIFSLGVIFFELLTGKRPYPSRHGNFDDVVASAIDDREASLPPVRGLNPGVPPSLTAVIRRCLAPEPSVRYRSMEELAEDLGRHLDHQPLRHAPDRSLLERGSKWLRRHPRVSSAGGMAALAAVAVLFLVGLLLARGRHLDRLAAESAFEKFRQQQPSLFMALGVPRTESQILTGGIHAARTALGVYGVLADKHWQQRSQYASLPEATRKELDQRIAEMLYLLARAHLELARTETNPHQRIVLIEQATKINLRASEIFSPGDLPRALQRQRADLLDLSDASADAEAIRVQVEQSSSRTAMDQYAKIHELLDAGSYEKAAPLLVALRNRNPTDPAPWLLLGDANAAMRRLHVSEGCFSTAIALRSESCIGYFHRGLCRLELKQYEDALADFKQVIKMRPQLAGGYLNRALVYRAMGHNKEAMADLSTALKLGATQTRIYFLRSELRLRLGDKAGAQSDLQMGLKLEPTDELSWVARGLALLQSNPEAALADFQRALELNPASVTALRNCIHVLADRLDRPAEAMKALDRLLALDAEDADALAGRAVLFARQGNRQAALADVQKLLKISKQPKALFQAACALSMTSAIEKKDAAKALILLSRAVLANPLWLIRSRTDPDLSNLRATDEYQTLVDGVESLKKLLNELHKPSRTDSATAGVGP